MEDLPNRKSIRLKDYDYSQDGTYFITICTHDRVNLYGDIIVGADSISARMKLNHAGQMIQNIFDETINSYNTVISDIYVIMPNHFHCILSLSRADIESAPTVGDIIQSFKRNTTIKYINGVKSGIYPSFNKRIWQRNYYEHIIRDDEEYQTIWQYIDENPAKWDKDKYYI
ncbi:MAG: transposase [Oscillospiraceae bacterium]|nr:transposase [Oscillospiraceae bacterium]